MNQTPHQAHDDTVTRTVASGVQTIELATVGGTAAAGGDYTAVHQTLTFAVGELTKTVVVALTDDLAVEGGADESVIVAIGNASGGTIATVTSQASIQDNDGTRWVVLAAASTESGGFVSFVVSRAGVLDAATIHFDTGPGAAAMAGQDFTGVSRLLSFAVGEEHKLVMVPITDDNIPEVSEGIMGVISNASSGSIVTASVSSALGANDLARTFFSITNVGSIGEDTAVATYTISRAGDVSALQTVEYYDAGGTASAGSDYVAYGPETLTFLPGETSRTVSVDLLGDSIVDGNDTLVMGLRNASGGVIRTSTFLLNLTDNETPAAATSYTIAVTSNDVYENTGTAAYTITRGGDLSAASTSYFRVNDDTAMAGSDYTGIAGQTLQWGVGESRKVVMVSLLDDAAAESSETIIGEIATDSGFTTGTATATLTLLDNDTAPTGANSYTIASIGNTFESAGVLGYTITRGGDLTITGTSYFRTNGGTATDGADYTSVAGQTLSWGVGEAVKVVTVALADDVGAEGFKTVIGQSATDSGFTTDTGTATVIILDDDAQVMAAGVADTLTIGTASGTYVGGSILDTGDMADIVTSVSSAITANSVVNLGAGDDTLIAGTWTLGSRFLGGTGVDTLAINALGNYDFVTFTSQGDLMTGFEIVSLKAAGNQIVTLSLDDVLEFTRGNVVADTLHITGNASDTLNLRALGKTSATPAPGIGNLTDVDGGTYDVVASSAGNAAANDVSIGGETYDVYQYQHNGHTVNLLVNTLLTTNVI